MTFGSSIAADRSRRTLRSAIGAVVAAVLMTTGLPAAAQKEWREYPGYERGWSSGAELPTDYRIPGEFVVGRLMYPQARRGWALGTGGGDWRFGGTAWAVDYPRGDRTFAQLLKRLTGIDVRSVEQPVNLDDGNDAYYWPFLITGLVGSWDLTDSQVQRLREHLLRGGFLLCDSFYGRYEWEGFERTIKRVFPDRPIIELGDDHPIFHAVFDLTDKRQVPTWQHLPRGYRGDGAVPRWRAIVDDEDRVMVMIAFNNDIADGWQRADEPTYPQPASNLAIRLGVNFAVYALTH
jgi:hypothetical protein